MTETRKHDVEMMSDSRPEICMRTAVIVHSAASEEVIETDHGVTRLQETHRQEANDEQMVELWLHGRSAHTQRAYRADAAAMMKSIGRPLRAVTLGDLQSYADQLGQQNLAPVTRHRKLAAVKSLFAFAHRLGYIHFDTARPLQLPKLADKLAQRILSESEVKELLRAERHPRNRAILHLFYFSGMRVSELAGLKWSDLQERADGGQVTIFGKGGQTRTVLLPLASWLMLDALKTSKLDAAPVFASRRGQPLHPSQILRIVKKVAAKAGIAKAVSPHWLRHAHASHALDGGAPIHLVQATLGHSSVATTGRYLHARPTESSSQYLPL